MKDIVNDLLASSHNKKDKHNFVLKEYLKILYASASNPTSKLKYTNQRFIQMYVRQMNRTLEGNATINEDVDQANAITAVSDELSKTKDIQGKIIVPEARKDPIFHLLILSLKLLNLHKLVKDLLEFQKSASRNKQHIILSQSNS